MSTRKYRADLAAAIAEHGEKHINVCRQATRLVCCANIYIPHFKWLFSARALGVHNSSAAQLTGAWENWAKQRVFSAGKSTHIDKAPEYAEKIHLFFVSLPAPEFPLRVSYDMFMIHQIQSQYIGVIASRRETTCKFCHACGKMCNAVWCMSLL